MSTPPSRSTAVEQSTKRSRRRANEEGRGVDEEGTTVTAMIMTMVMSQSLECSMKAPSLCFALHSWAHQTLESPPSSSTVNSLVTRTLARALTSSLHHIPVVVVVCSALVGSKRVSVSRTAGHTKWAQTIPVLPKSLHLLDTPGLVFPALLQPPTLPATVTTEQLQMVRDEERAIQECCGVLPLAQVREPYSAVRFLAQHLPLEVMYGLRLPKVSTHTHTHTTLAIVWRGSMSLTQHGCVLACMQGESAWSPLVLCEALAEKRGYHLARTGRPDAHRAGREMLAVHGAMCACVGVWTGAVLTPWDVGVCMHQDCVDGVSQLRFKPPA